MADQHDDKAAALGESDQLLRRAAHLADRAGCAVERVEIHRLDRIDHDEVGRLRRIEGLDDVAHAARRGEADRAVGDAEPLGAQADLVDCFLAGDVGGRAAVGGERGGQDRRAGHQPAAAHSVELGDAGLTARRPGGLAAQRDEIEAMAAAAAGSLPEALRRAAARHFLSQAVPGAAGFAPPGPFRRDRAALLAGEAGLRLGHAPNLAKPAVARPSLRPSRRRFAPPQDDDGLWCHQKRTSS